MVIHGPITADYDVDIGPVMLSDWYHSDYFTLVNETMQGAVPLSNNNLVSTYSACHVYHGLTLCHPDQRQDELPLRQYNSCVHTKRRHQQV
jgi:hypothetical protein